MAANPKTLRIVGSYPLGSVTRALEIACVDAPPFAAVGGKYVIIHTGAMSGDKPVKRAYSLLPVAGSSDRARLTIKRLGPGSKALHDAPVGSELAFSGPWGKLVPDGGLAPSTLVVATDTGITAAMGVVQADRGSSGQRIEVLWLRSEDEAFLDVDDVRRHVTGAGARFVHAEIPDVLASERVSAAWAHVDARVAELGATLVIAAGDGAIVHPLRDRLTGAPDRPVRDVRIECFFRNPEKKSV